MDLLAPLGPVYQAGTLSGNPLAMAAGAATLQYLTEHRSEIYPLLEVLSESLVSGVAAEAARAGVSITSNRVGGMFTWFFTSGAVTDYASAAKSDTAAFARFHRAMLESGAWLPCSQFEAAFLSAAHTPADIRQTVEAAGSAFRTIAKAT
jgi:glutamate-1-semialdehyde 2,1-aminomutase